MVQWSLQSVEHFQIYKTKNTRLVNMEHFTPENPNHRDPNNSVVDENGQLVTCPTNLILNPPLLDCMENYSIDHDIDRHFHADQLIQTIHVKSNENMMSNPPEHFEYSKELTLVSNTYSNACTIQQEVAFTDLYFDRYFQQYVNTPGPSEFWRLLFASRSSSMSISSAKSPVSVRMNNEFPHGLESGMPPSVSSSENSGFSDETSVFDVETNVHIGEHNIEKNSIYQVQQDLESECISEAIASADPYTPPRIPFSTSKSITPGSGKRKRKHIIQTKSKVQPRKSERRLNNTYSTESDRQKRIRLQNILNCKKAREIKKQKMKDMEKLIDILKNENKNMRQRLFLVYDKIQDSTFEIPCKEKRLPIDVDSSWLHNGTVELKGAVSDDLSPDDRTRELALLFFFNTYQPGDDISSQQHLFAESYTVLNIGIFVPSLHNCTNLERIWYGVTRFATLII